MPRWPAQDRRGLAETSCALGAPYGDAGTGAGPDLVLEHLPRCDYDASRLAGPRR